MTGAIIVLFFVPKYQLDIENSTQAKCTGRKVDLDKLVIKSISYVGRCRQYVSPNNVIVSL